MTEFYNLSNKIFGKVKRKLRKGSLNKCTVCGKCDMTEQKTEFFDPLVLLWFKCNICNSIWLECFKAEDHKLMFNGRLKK